MPNKYVTLADLKGIVDAKTSADDLFLQDALDWAEGEFEKLAGTQFNQSAEVNATPRRAFVDRYGWLTLVANERAPLTAVTAVSVRFPWASTWQTLAWDATNGIIMPPADTAGPPSARAWKVMLLPTAPRLSMMAEGDLLVRWSYTGGYAQAPARLRMIIERMAQWKYKLREAPLGRVSMPAMGVTEVIPGLPDDLKADIRLWENVTL